MPEEDSTSSEDDSHEENDSGSEDTDFDESKIKFGPFFLRGYSLKYTRKKLVAMRRSETCGEITRLFYSKVKDRNRRNAKIRMLVEGKLFNLTRNPFLNLRSI